MEYKVRELENWRREIDVKVPAEIVTPKLESAYRKYRQGMKLEGFRKGKIPVGLVKKMLGKQIEGEVFETFSQQAFSEILKQNTYKIVSPPEVKDYSYDPDKGLSFIIYFDVQPQFSLPEYKGIEVEKEVYEVSKEDVDQYLEDLRQQHAMMYTLEGEAQLGHYIHVDLQQLDRTGIPIIGKKYDDRVIHLEYEDNEVTRQLLGVKAGDERRVRIEIEPEESTVEKPESEESEEIYSVKVRTVSERKLPDLDDEFAKDLGEFDSLEELRQKIKDQLIQRVQATTEQKLRRDLANELIKSTELTLPESLLTRYVDAVVNDSKKEKSKKLDEEQVRHEARSMAIRNLKWLFIREQLAKQENLSVTDAEVEAALSSLRASGRKGMERARNLEKDQEELDNFKTDILEEKILNFLAQHAKVKERKVKKKKDSELAI